MVVLLMSCLEITPFMEKWFLFILLLLHSSFTETFAKTFAKICLVQIIWITVGYTMLGKFVSVRMQNLQEGPVKDSVN